MKREQQLNGAGLRGVRVHTKMVTPKGEGGAAHPSRSMMMPTVIDSLPGVLQSLVVQEDIPGLLPLSFQEKQGAMINPSTNKLHLPCLGAVVHMHRTPGGHRTIDVTTGPTPAAFRIPDGVPEHYYLTWDQFLAKRVIKSAAQDEELARKQHRRIMTQTSQNTTEPVLD